ncbi:peptide chain release factor N(5)-glutamine methyltransferase [Flavobacterium silvisoli]|uniref:Release factor glutamine methyltransferase n=1 Tax=Flavobacterium silvisoli TaxID=2529433 RepID=A0A4Q9Z4X0_9FLAO|nr:peptide chain release factor N(5)-glutamine methyltransferase [Flavobacterium silvisoli]TBX70436.1 peptide chain release factor N(5)-glutamine methyltransferase [Flavobacterium silvisoli]
MLFKQYKAIFLRELASLYDEKEIESFFYLTLEHFHHKKRIDLALNPEMEMDASQLSQWESVLADLKKYKPIQYILGNTEFYGLPFVVNEQVLIPRPETEELVALILTNNSNPVSPDMLTILDIGTGSGCIPISLKKNLPNAAVFAIDVSKEALATAQKNAALNKVEVNFMLQNILDTQDLGQQFDIIVSNPPYVRHLEKNEINPNVLDYEPHLALFVEDDDALLFYRKIAELARINLKPGGQLYFEINQYLGNETVEFLQSLGFSEVKLLKDIYGNDRMVFCLLPSAFYS